MYPDPLALNARLTLCVRSGTPKLLSVHRDFAVSVMITPTALSKVRSKSPWDMKGLRVLSRQRGALLYAVAYGIRRD